MKKPKLDDAYALKTPGDSLRLYGDWADTYDADFAQAMDYRLPAEVAQAFARAGGTGPVLDVGAGTGLVGQHLAKLRIGPVDGTDISTQMLKVAEAKGVYRRVFAADITRKTAIQPGTYSGIISAGTFTLGHIGPEPIEELLLAATRGAQFALTINAEHFERAGFAAKFAGLAGRIKYLTFKDVRIYGDGADAAHRNDMGRIALFKKA